MNFVYIYDKFNLKSILRSSDDGQAGTILLAFLNSPAKNVSQVVITTYINN